MAPSWTLAANSGKTTFFGEVRKRFTLADGQPAILAAIRLSGEFWRQDQSGTGNGSSDVTPDFDISLPQLVLNEFMLRELLYQLDTWLEHFDAGRSEPEGFEAELSTATGQKLSICVGANEGWIVSPGKVGCVIRCASQNLRDAEVRFVTDQSCLRLFRNDLQMLLLAC